MAVARSEEAAGSRGRERAAPIPPRRAAFSRAIALLLVAATLPACGERLAPPPHTTHGGLPVSGSLADARLAGFTRCVEDTTTMRCRRSGVMLEGQGPFNAAVDLAGSDGGGGFDQLTLWHDRDQYAVYAVGDALERSGWTACSTGNDSRGDQHIYTRPGAAVRFSMDLSYWGKRRLRVISAFNRRERGC